MGQAKKLIEVALPLEAINAASAREKSIRHGHPSTLHLWWARRPLAAARAVLFTSLVDDPDDPEAPKEYVDACRALPAGHYSDSLDTPRGRLFDFIETLVQWENSNNEEVLETARRMIHLCTDGNPPPVYDPFAGGGTIPLEAQRLGLEAHASDLNPVAVLINKAMIEIPPKFAGNPPVNPEVSQDLIAREWKGAQGLAEDVRYYGKWMRDEAFKRIGHLYPKVQLPESEGGGEATVIAWIWARTVKCPNPACACDAPLLSTFWLSKRKKSSAYVWPSIDRSTSAPRVTFQVNQDVPVDVSAVSVGTKFVKPDGRRAKGTFSCPCCGEAIGGSYIDEMANSVGLGRQMTAVVADGPHGRVYLSPTSEQFDGGEQEFGQGFGGTQRLFDGLDVEARGTFAGNAQGRRYGFERFHDYYTPRQLLTLSTLTELIRDLTSKVLEESRSSGLTDDSTRIRDGGTGAPAYADAVSTYLGFAVDRMADYSSTLVTWESSGAFAAHTFTRQAIPMTWDFAEVNPFSQSTGNLLGAVTWIARVIERLPTNRNGRAIMWDAREPYHLKTAFVATDPPYYDNIGYADLSDYFYVWLRKSLRHVYPSELTTLLVPKGGELIAAAHRFNGDKGQAKEFFEEGLSSFFTSAADMQNRAFPMTVYYAFKQVESDASTNGRVEQVSTGWETMLQALINAGFAVSGTWPLRTERTNRSVGIGANALASSVVLSCRVRAADAGVATRGQLIPELRETLENAVGRLQAADTPPVDLDQAAIGPGMAVFSKYERVMEGSGRMTVRSALVLINHTIEEILTGSDADYDSYTRWAISWFQQYGFKEGAFGDAETLSKAKDVSVSGLTEAGFLHAKAGKVRILKRQELDSDWDPQSDGRLTVWEITHYLIRNLEKDGEEGAARLLAKVSSEADSVKELCYRLFSICEKNGWAQEALGYNMLISSWPEIARLAAELPAAREGEFDFG